MKLNSLDVKENNEYRIKAVIMAGGVGSRISEFTLGYNGREIPKPMLRLANMPVLERAIYSLRNQGFRDIIITVSYLADVIINYFGDGSKISPVTGKEFGVSISYFVERDPLGNAGALFRIKNQLTEDFLLLNADSVFDIDFSRFINYHQMHHGIVTLFTHPNSHPYDSGLLITGDNGIVIKWITREEDRPKWCHNRVNAGIHIINMKALDYAEKRMGVLPERIDLDRMILKPLAGQYDEEGNGLLVCYDSPEYVKDMGTPDRFKRVESDCCKGIVKNKNLKNKQKAVFLDRDGTINKYIGFLKNIDDFELIDGVAEAICRINEAGYLAIVITNQPVIARGEVTFDELDEIHRKMETLLGEKGAYIDGLYFCPHHPEKGFEGEISEFKRDCDCRKPKPGLLYKAAKDFNIDLQESWLIGDGENDISCGQAAKIKGEILLIGEGSQTKYSKIKESNNYHQNFTCNFLHEAVDYILKSID